MTMNGAVIKLDLIQPSQEHFKVAVSIPFYRQEN